MTHETFGCRREFAILSLFRIGKACLAVYAQTVSLRSLVEQPIQTLSCADEARMLFSLR